MNNSIANDEFFKYLLSVQLLPGCAEAIVSIIGVPANLLVIFIWFKIGTDPNHHDTRVHNNNHWFILGMTLADLIFCSIQSPLMAVHFLSYRTITYGEGKRYLSTVTQTTTAASSINILLLNIDKFIYLNRPLRYYSIVTTRRAIVALVIGWIIAVGGAIFFIFGPFTGFKHGALTTKSINYLVFATIYFVLPIAISFCISLYIAIIAMRASKNLAFGYTVTDESIQRHSITSRRSTMKMRFRLKTIAFIFITTVWCTLTYIPYRTVYILDSAQIVDFIDHLWLVYALYALRSLAAAGNPFITMLIQPEYRKQLRRSICSKGGQNGTRLKNGSKNSSYTGLSALPSAHRLDNTGFGDTCVG